MNFVSPNILLNHLNFKKSGVKLMENESGRKFEVNKIELLSKLDLVNFANEYSQFFEYAPVSYFILDKNGEIINVNKKATKQLKATKQQLIGKNFSSFIISEKSYHQHRNLILETKQQQQMECEIKRKDGYIFSASIDSFFINDHFLSIINNVSEQKAKENRIVANLVKEKELNEMKSQFITIASHEFKTPLSTILTSTELIEKYINPIDEIKRRKHFRKIKTSVQRLNEILMDFMSANKIENGEIKNNPKMFKIIEFIEEIVEEVKYFNETHQVSFLYDNLSPQIYLDPLLLKICIVNLLINSYKYTQEGGIIEVKIEQNNFEDITIIVKDNGIGIPIDDQKHLFEAFFRAKNVYNIQGTGLGLNITQKLINLMGGSISFSSQENKGATFYLKFQQVIV